ncbi:DNA repair protein RecO [Patescibacteria group bacterium]
MTRSYKTKGIVIRRYNVGEADRLLDIYTPTLGKIKIKARGVRRTQSKLAGHLEIFSETDLVLVPGKSADIVTGARAINFWPAIRDDLTRTAIAYYFCELVFWLTEEGYKDTRLYNLLYWSLAALDSWEDSNDVSRDLFVANVELLFLDRLGYRPELKKCAATGDDLQPEQNYFSAVAGGVVCQKNKDSIPVSVNTIKVLRLMTEDKVKPDRWQKIPIAVRNEAKKTVREFVHYTLEKKLKAESFLEMIPSLMSQIESS